MTAVPDYAGRLARLLAKDAICDRFEERNGEWRILARVVTMEWSEHRPGATLGAETLAQFKPNA